jgi:pimeloyl-ACP methyl ester carboxylesterase
VTRHSLDALALACAASFAAFPLIACREARSEGGAGGKPEARDCQVTLCMAGAFQRGDGANPAFERLCERLPGIAKECSGGRCYAMFSMVQVEQALEALIASLDSDRDGRVTGGDRRCDVALAGYSWGGVNALELARRVATSPRFDAERRTVARVALIDPFAPHVGARLEVAGNVQAIWSYRHSVSPPSDCSAHAPLGPYRGIPLACAGSTRCRDRDLTADGVSRDEVGHCAIVEHVAAAVEAHLTTGSDAPPIARR